MNTELINDLKRVRNYFGEHDTTISEHAYFDIIGKVISFIGQQSSASVEPVKSIEDWFKNSWYNQLFLKNMLGSNDIIKMLQSYIEQFKGNAPVGVMEWVSDNKFPEPFEIVICKVLYEDYGPRQDWALKWGYVDKDNNWQSIGKPIKVKWLYEPTKEDNKNLSQQGTQC